MPPGHLACTRGKKKRVRGSAASSDAATEASHETSCGGSHARFSPDQGRTRASSQADGEGAPKKKAKRCSHLAWKQVKPANDVFFQEAGFMRLEELQVDPSLSSQQLKALMRGEGTVVNDEEPREMPFLPEDTVDDELDALPTCDSEKGRDDSTASPGAAKAKQGLAEPPSRTSKAAKEVDAASKSPNQTSDAVAARPSDQRKFAKRKCGVAVPEEKLKAASSKLAEWTTLYHLDSRLLYALKKCKFLTPTNIQKIVIPQALNSRCDIIGSAETGSGKTLAFGLPIAHQILEILGNREASSGRDDLKCLILAPTRELVLQIADHLAQITRYAPIRIVSIIGGISMAKQLRLLSSRPDILVATPGRLWDVTSTGSFSNCGMNLGTVRFLVFDEADKMVEDDRFDEISYILRSVYQSRRDLLGSATSCPIKPIQTYVFSATMCINSRQFDEIDPKTARTLLPSISAVASSKLDWMRALSKTFKRLFEYVEFQREVKVLSTDSQDLCTDGLQEAKIFCVNEQKLTYLYYFFLRYKGRTLVFVNSISSIKKIIDCLRLLGVPSWGMHANMQQRQRLKVLSKFRSDANSVLISTDLLSRGLDIPSIDYVIHYHVPSSAELYVHRSGRTARAYNPGIALVFVGPSERPAFSKITSSLNRNFPDFPVEMDTFVPAQERASVAEELYSLQNRRTLERSRGGWIKKLADELDVDIPRELREPTDEATLIQERLERERRLNRIDQLKHDLKALLKQPILLHGASKSYITKDRSLKDWLDNDRSDVAQAIDQVKSNKKAHYSTEFLKRLQKKKKLLA
ncbi:ATP-dependent RNA helicase ddx24-like [Schistocerca gregaria]|uniref:ATP-dependent RNA helicase ddx24-like n=1 Tax=Schistocerca gregaria TaxID=7010 RepID=UPI00211E52E5|nr:ATP-dependent RNA helicase ddx24-like [Schistocerca gregaria]